MGVKGRILDVAIGLTGWSRDNARRRLAAAARGLRVPVGWSPEGVDEAAVAQVGWGERTGPPGFFSSSTVVPSARDSQRE
jgi:hypothetical protein